MISWWLSVKQAECEHSDCWIFENWTQPETSRVLLIDLQHSSPEIQWKFAFFPPTFLERMWLGKWWKTMSFIQLNSGNVTFLKIFKRTCSNRFRTWRLISSGVLSTKLKIPFIIRSNWWNDFQIQKFKGRKKTGKKSEHEVGPENWKSRRRQHTGCWWFLVAFCWEGENLFRPL